MQLRVANRKSTECVDPLLATSEKEKPQRRGDTAHQERACGDTRTSFSASAQSIAIYKNDDFNDCCSNNKKLLDTQCVFVCLFVY